MIKASCGHEIKDVNDCITLFSESVSRDGEICLRMGDYCKDCAKELLNQPRVWDDYNTATEEVFKE